MSILLRYALKLRIEGRDYVPPDPRPDHELCDDLHNRMAKLTKDLPRCECCDSLHCIDDFIF